MTVSQASSNTFGKMRKALVLDPNKKKHECAINTCKDVHTKGMQIKTVIIHFSLTILTKITSSTTQCQQGI